MTHLKSGHKAKVEEPRKITLQRKTTSTLRVAGSKSISVEVRKKKVFVQRSPEEIEAERKRELDERRAVENAARQKAEEEASSAPKKKRVASLLLRVPLQLTPLRRRHCIASCRASPRKLRWPPLHLHLSADVVARKTNSVVRTNHVTTTTIVAAAAVVMAIAKTLRIVRRSRKRRQRHALRHVLPTKKAMASVVVVAARPS